jgi:hypothetical protein
MLRLNEHLGYVTTRSSITVSRALPLNTCRRPVLLYIAQVAGHRSHL